MVSILCLSLLPCPQAYWSSCVSTFADISHLRLGHPTSRVFNFLVFKNKIACTSRCSLVQCQAYPLGKSSCLLLKPTSHKTTAPLDLIFSDAWSPAPIFFLWWFSLLFYFCWCNIYGIILLLWNLMYFLLSTFFKFLLSVSFHEKLNMFKLIGVMNITS
jgi:hypothetical protein